MKWQKLERLNSQHYLEEAFEDTHTDRMLKDALIRRNVYVVLFAVAIAGLIWTIFMGRMILSFLFLFLGTLYMATVSKYDTQLCFLRILKKRKARAQTPDHSVLED